MLNVLIYLGCAFVGGVIGGFISNVIRFGISDIINSKKFYTIQIVKTGIFMTILIGCPIAIVTLIIELL